MLGGTRDLVKIAGARLGQMPCSTEQGRGRQQKMGPISAEEAQRDSVWLFGYSDHAFNLVGWRLNSVSCRVGDKCKCLLRFRPRYHTAF